MNVARALVMLLLLGVGAARAESIKGESPRYLNLELKLGSFFPLIDEEPALVAGGQTPYADTFGANASMLRFEIEITKYIYQGYGAVSAGIGAGYAEKFAAGVTADTGVTSTEKVGIRFYPLRVVAEYRFDYAALHWNVPLVPYGKAALVCIPWQAAAGSNVDVSNGIKGGGARWGWAVTGGLALMLDFLEPRLARDFDSELGVNHTYIFAEYTHEQVDNFGRPGLNLSSRRFMFGLALDI